MSYTSASGALLHSSTPWLASRGAPRASRFPRWVQQAPVAPPTYAQEALKYCADLIEPARRGVGSATELANVDADFASDALTASELVLGDDEDLDEVVEPQPVDIERGSASASSSTLSSFFDDLETDLQHSESSSAIGVGVGSASRCPKVRRAPRQVLPRVLVSESVQADRTQAAEGALPRSITLRPQLPSHRSPRILPSDEWIVQPQPSSDVHHRLRASETGEAWTQQRLLPLLSALNTAGYHSNTMELVTYICQNHVSVVAELDLSKSPLSRLLEEWSQCYAIAPAAVHLIHTSIDCKHRVPAATDETSPSSRLLRIGLAAAASTGDVAACRKFFDCLARSSDGVDGQAFGLLITAHGQAGEWREATQLLSQMQKSGIAATVKTYTTLIKACTDAGAPDRGVELFSEMEADGVQADLHAYNSLMGAFSRCGEWERVWSVLGAMRRAGVDPDVVSYNTLLKACERAGEWHRVVEIYKRLQRECDGSGRLQPNVITFNTLIGAAGSAGEWEQALQFYDEMTEWRLRPDKVTMSSLVNALERAGEWQLAVAKFSELRERGVRPNAICYNAAISALAKGAQAEAAKELVATMRSEGYTPDIYTYAPLVGALGGAGLVEEAMQVWDDMQEAGVVPNSYVYVALINACERSSDWRRAVRVFYAMRDSGVEMNSLNLAARQIIYHWPQVLEQLPPPIVAAARAAVDTGRAARSTVHRALKSVPTQL